MMQTSRSPKTSPTAIPPIESKVRWPGLDGLRGVAVLLVFGFHLPIEPFGAGSYGVTVFFVLSGFLITNILLEELRATEGVQLRWFYGRRTARLLPALLLVTLGHLVLQLTVLGQPELWWERTWPVLTYMANLATVNGTDLVHMRHTWSLAIEEHFYLLWPVILIALKPRWRLAAAWLLAIVFACWRLALLVLGSDDLRIAFSTDTNAFALFLGCALAISHFGRPRAEVGRNVSALSVASIIAVSNVAWDFADRRLLYLAIPVAGLTAVAVGAAISTPTAWLMNPVLRWFGRVSYGLYLWHFVLISMPWESLPLPPIVPMILAPIAMATASYYLVEEPVRSWWRAYELRKRRPSPTPIAGRFGQPLDPEAQVQ